MVHSNVFLVSIIFVLVAGIWADENETEVDMKVSIDEVIGALKAIGAGCDKEPTEENIRDLVLNKEEVSMDSKCFRRCVIEQFDLHEPEGVRVREDKVVELASMVYPERSEEFGTMTHICNEKIAELADKCEAAHQYGMCVFREMQERNFDIPQFDE